MTKKRAGSSIDDFLKEEGVFEEAQAQAVKEVAAWKPGKTMKRKTVSKKKMATATMTIRIPDSKHKRLRLLAESHGISLNRLVDDWASMALAQFDAQTRFNVRAARGNAKRGLDLLDKLDRSFTNHENCRKSSKGSR